MSPMEDFLELARMHRRWQVASLVERVWQTGIRPFGAHGARGFEPRCRHTNQRLPLISHPGARTSLAPRRRLAEDYIATKHARVE